MSDNTKTIQDREPNFRDEQNNLFLVHCFNCDYEFGRENYSSVVSCGYCNWCGWGRTTKANPFGDSCQSVADGCGDFKQKSTNWYDVCKHGNCLLFCNACRYVPENDPLDSTSKEISRLRKENERLEEENKMLKGTCIRSSDDIDSYIAAKRHIDHLERIINRLLNSK